MSKVPSLSLVKIFQCAVFCFLVFSLFQPVVLADPHPIIGTVEFEDGSAAVGADVLVSRVGSDETVSTTVLSDGAWQVDVGDPGLAWPAGTSFTVKVTSPIDDSISVEASGSISGSFSDVGLLVLADSSSDDPRDDENPTVPPPLVNRAPVALVSAGEPYRGVIGEAIVFDGSDSYDPDGQIKAFEWDFGDGQTGSEMMQSHLYSEIGVYEVLLTVTDDLGLSDSISVLAVISQPTHVPEKPTIQGPTSSLVNETITFVFSGSDPDNDSIRFLISWGDEDNTTTNYYDSDSSLSITHTFVSKGMFLVSVLVQDDFGAASSEATHVIGVGTSFEFVSGLVNGFVFDNDSDGRFDLFYNNATKHETTVVDTATAIYHLDSDGDGLPDFSFDSSLGMVSVYEPLDTKDDSNNGDEKQNETPGFGLLFSFIAVFASVFVLYAKRK